MNIRYAQQKPAGKEVEGEREEGGGGCGGLTTIPLTDLRHKNIHVH